MINDSISGDSLFKIIGELTLEMRDIHVYLSSSFGNYHYSKKDNYHENPPVNTINYLSDIYLSNTKCVFADIQQTNYAYLQIKSFTGDENLFSQAASSLDTIKNRDGIVIDIRSNGGGNELNGRTVAGRFIKNDTIYKYTRVRDGPGWDDFTGWRESILPSDRYLGFEKPVILLTNRRVYSSAELFTLMMKTYQNLILVGDTTGGSSANPSEKKLPNGWIYRVSTWQAASVDFKLIEDNGIPPDHYVLMTENSIEEGKDLILEKAIDLLDAGINK